MAEQLQSGQDVTALMNPPVLYGDESRPKTAVEVAEKGLVAGKPLTIHAPTGYEPVTLSDLKEDPVESIQRMGRLLKRDVSDPRLWVTLAASYFGPKIISAALPVVARAASSALSGAVRGTAAVADTVSPDVVGIVSPRAGKALEVAQALRNKMQAAQPPAAPPAPAPPATAPISPVESVPGGTPPPVGPPAAATPATTTPAPMPPPAAVPMRAGETLATPLAQRTPGQMSETWLSSDVGIAARRLGVTLTPAQQQTAVTAVRQAGVSPLEAVQQLASAAPEGGVLYQQLRTQGLTDQQAKALIASHAAMQQLQQKLGTMTPEQVDAEIAARVGNRSPKRD